jgi:lysophospholipase L1-like esterase
MSICSKKTVGYLTYLFLVIFFGTELFLQFITDKNDNFYIFPPNQKFLRVTNPDFTPGVYRDAYFEANEFGIRADSYDRKFKKNILILGGSTAIDEFLHQELTWANQLQMILNTSVHWNPTWVGNLGKSARHSGHHLDYMQRIVPYMPKPDYILILLGANDLQLALRSSYRNLNADEELMFNYAVHPDTSFVSNFGIYRFYRKMKLWRLREKYAFVSGSEGIKIWRECRQSVKEARHINILPDAKKQHQYMKDNLQEIVSLAQSYNAEVILITQPTLWNVASTNAEKSLLISGGVGPNTSWCKEKKYYSLGALTKGISAINQITRDFCSENKLKCIDLARLLPPSTEYFFDDMHFNEDGAHRVAEIIAHNLME